MSDERAGRSSAPPPSSAADRRRADAPPPSWLTPERVATVAVVSSLALAKLLLAGAALRGTEFAAVSDDDYARVVIAEAFAHTPKLDPSGTSWLPFPFWLNGGAMMVLGRHLAAARAIAVMSGVASVVLAWAGARAAGLTTPRAVLAALLFAATPWAVWLGVATVPEALTAGLVGAGVPLALAEGASPRRRVMGAFCIFLAALSRYEAWPVAAAAVGWLGWLAARRRARPAEVLPAALLLAAGPLAWMAWNAHAHADALHFVARVTRFRRAAGQADGPLLDKLVFYPRALAKDAPEMALFLVATVGGAAWPRTRARALPIAVVALAVLAFLVVGCVKDGAPTHHPARALVVLFPLVAIGGVDAMAESLGRLGARAKALAMLIAVGALGLVWSPAWRAPPGTDLASDRSPQVALGLELRARARKGDAPRLRVTPCAYEHFALIAALGAPERVETATREPGVERAPSDPCPRVEEMR